MDDFRGRLRKMNKWFITSMVLVGLIIIYAGTGFAMKATDQAAFCGSCHVMSEAVRTYERSVHAGISCNDCHAPHDTVPKIIFKAQAGAKDIYKNTVGDVDDIIRATAKTKEIVNANCSSCHTMTNVNVAMDAKEYCTDCHQHVPHFRKTPIGERRVAGE